MAQCDQRAKLIWFTGLPSSGKSTMALQIQRSLRTMGFRTYILDGDELRRGLNKDLGFADHDRHENIRRAGEVAAMFVDAGLIVLASFISPFRSDRLKIQQRVGDENYIEVFVDCPLDICERRDVKGLYRKARQGQLPAFTGIDSPYEMPEHPHVRLCTGTESIEECSEQVLRYVLPRISVD